MRQNFPWSTYIFAILTAIGYPPAAGGEDPSAEVLSVEQLQQIDHSLSRALDWLASEQEASGAFPTTDSGQPAVTSLCLLAFMAQGHLPNEGKFGAEMKRAVNYVLDIEMAVGMWSGIPTMSAGEMHLRLPWSFSA